MVSDTFHTAFVSTSLTWGTPSSMFKIGNVAAAT